MASCSVAMWSNEFSRVCIVTGETIRERSQAEMERAPAWPCGRKAIGFSTLACQGMVEPTSYCCGSMPKSRTVKRVARS